MRHPLVEEAAKKAAIAWLTVPGGAEGVLVWCHWIDPALYVVTGPGEQEVPGLAEATQARVTLRGDHGGRVVTWPADVGRVRPDSPEWTAVAPQLAGKRLNASGTAEELVRRWARQCAVVRLTQKTGPIQAGDWSPDGSLAEPPRPTPAARPARRPFRLHRVRKR
jgi:hypothetical protein